MTNPDLGHMLSIRDGMSRAIAAVTSILVVALIAFVVWEIFSPPSSSLIVKLKEKLGVAEAEALRAQQTAQAKFEGDVRLAVGQADAYRTAYTTLYSSYGQLMNSFYDVEAKMIAAQQEKIGQTQFVDVIGTNVASAACMLSLFDTSGELQSACSVKEAMQHNMMNDYPTLLSQHRSTLPQDLLASVPRPEHLMSAEFARLKAEYREE